MQKIGKDLAKKIIRKGNKKALIVGLEGELGSGKTTFIQGLAKGLGIEELITSPTFVIMKRYNFPKGELYHIDCYRIDLKDLIELDFKEIINNPKNIVVIEWAEKIKDILPNNVIWMKFEYLDKNMRKVIYVP
ncbi:tRNA (adenosine(37)-N6)-threonylcarbamoyltransferase complex ATPase subunit type 1 TsaE [Patescibacteria group bacterium]|nr:tRNA (adenosine(37)-N6)-threonylcarbamoyltransferase complex ATPase subunit type 1 TsaE [Patescibacteria group bacterium]MBU2472460.1 tRNA (adenosine(37)-N6)-threonylcarbamoyltransferase complex ATPase subunit type 1 TsaE [Patescibacteria group bacterium]